MEMQLQVGCNIGIEGDKISASIDASWIQFVHYITFYVCIIQRVFLILNDKWFVLLNDLCQANKLWLTTVTHRCHIWKL